MPDQAEDIEVVLIPPSVPMIIYASLTQVSVGKLCSGGVMEWCLE